MHVYYWNDNYSKEDFVVNNQVALSNINLSLVVVLVLSTSGSAPP